MITVIIPTLWKVDRLSTTLQELDACKYVGEIILIDNTERTKKIELNKLNHILEGKNTYVTAAWNKGVRLAKFDKLLILNDDTWFDWNSIADIENWITDSVGMIGISKENYKLKKTAPIEFKPISNIVLAFACAFFIHKKSWISIPEEMKIWGNDKWLFSANRAIGKSNYRLYNFKVNGQISKTVNFLRKNEKMCQIMTTDQRYRKKNGK